MKISKAADRAIELYRQGETIHMAIKYACQEWFGKDWFSYKKDVYQEVGKRNKKEQPNKPEQLALF